MLCSAGKDATEAFFSLHRYEVLERPQYKRLQIGVIQGEESILHGRVIGEISKVPYAEPTWLSPGYHSPYYSEVRSTYTVTIQTSLISWVLYQNHRRFQKVVREFAESVILPDAEAREADGKRPSQSVIDKMAYATFTFSRTRPDLTAC